MGGYQSRVVKTGREYRADYASFHSQIRKFSGGFGKKEKSHRLREGHSLAAVNAMSDRTYWLLPVLTG